jgi:putative protease
MVIKKKTKPKKITKKPIKGKAVVKKKVKKAAPKKKVVKKIKIKESDGKLIGRVVHFFDNINVAVIKLKSGLAIGDEIQIVGGDVDFKQEIKSMQMDHEKIQKAKPKDEIGLKVSKQVRAGYRVFKI